MEELRRSHTQVQIEGVFNDEFGVQLDGGYITIDFRRSQVHRNHSGKRRRSNPTI